MLPKANRLNQDKDIKKVVSKGQTFFLPQFVFKYLENSEDATKVGFIVSTKVDKKAVARNRLARQMREAASQLLPDLKPGYSVLVIAKRPALELDFATIVKQFTFAFSKIKIYNKA